MLLSAEEITKTYGARVLLDHVSFYLDAGQKVGIVGRNGAGKSTLLRMLAKMEEPETGRVMWDPGVRVNNLPQAPVFEGGTTVLEQVFAGAADQARAPAEYEAKTILTRLGVSCFDQPMARLSGGQRKRVALASVLARPCEVLILDEPTNHLDSEMVTWLEDYLRGMTGSLVMVTHDRYFLERVVNRIVEVEDGALYQYPGNYETYLEGRTQREEIAAASERKRQSILRREYQWVMQGPTARGTKSRERLERYEALKGQKGPEEKNRLELTASSSRLGKKTVELKKISKTLGDRLVIGEFSCQLLRDDRVGIVGANGSGKSTLLNLIAGRLSPDSGSVEIGETVRIGYFSQENPPMDPGMRVIDYVKEIGNTIETPEGRLTASQLLEKFLFPRDVQWSPIGKLSGGEKRRLFLLSILAAAPNVLLLDEPTNDLDLETLMTLEDYLEAFPGAVVTVSHDRYFLDKTVRRMFVVEGNGRVTAHPGGYTDYLNERAAAARVKATGEPAEKQAARRETTHRLKFSYNEQREYERIDDEIAGLEEKLADLKVEQQQKATDYVALQALQGEQQALEQTLDEKMDRWVYLNDLAERITRQEKEMEKR